MNAQKVCGNCEELYPASETYCWNCGESENPTVISDRCQDLYEKAQERIAALEAEVARLQERTSWTRIVEEDAGTLPEDTRVRWCSVYVEDVEITMAVKMFYANGKWFYEDGEECVYKVYATMPHNFPDPAPYQPDEVKE